MAKPRESACCDETSPSTMNVEVPCCAAMPAVAVRFSGMLEVAVFCRNRLPVRKPEVAERRVFSRPLMSKWAACCDWSSTRRFCASVRGRARRRRVPVPWHESPIPARPTSDDGHPVTSINTPPVPI